MIKKSPSMKHLQMTANMYDYLLEHSLKEHPVLQRIRKENQNDELTSMMQIAPEQGQFMAFLIKLLNVKQVLEIGTSTGYSSLVMALALPDDGMLLTCDVNESAGNKALQYWQTAKVEHKICLKLAPALQTLTELNHDKKSFDLIFIDADKTNYDAYFEASITLLQDDGIILIDNVLWGGAVADNTNTQDDTIAIRNLNSKLYSDERVELCMLPVADGLTLLRKK